MRNAFAAALQSMIGLLPAGRSSSRAFTLGFIAGAVITGWTLAQVMDEVVAKRLQTRAASPQEESCP